MGGRALLPMLLLAGCLSPALDGDGVPDPAAAADAALAWVAHAEGAVPRTEVASALAGGKMYVIGGFTSDEQAVGTVEVYDPATDSWSRGPDLPHAIHHTAAVGLDDGSVLVLGGYAGPPALPLAPPTMIPLFAPSRLAWRLDGDAWQPIAPLPAPRGAHAAALLDGKIVVAGGMNALFELAPEVWAYDPAADAWESLPDLPTPRDHLAAATVDGRLYAVAGQQMTHDKAQGDLEVYDPATGEWTVLPKAAVARAGLAASERDGRLVIVGGETMVDVFPQVEAFDPAAGAWSFLPDIPTARHGLGAATLDGRLYVLHGSTVANSAKDVVASVESLGAAG